MVDIASVATLVQSDHEEPELAILDLHLPDSTGTDSVHSAVALLPDTPVVVITGDHNPRQGEAALQAGAQDYMTRDQVDPRSLARSFRFAVHRHAQLRELRRANRALEHQATHDALSQLPNRAFFFSALEKAAARSARHGLRFAVAFIDINEFKSVNDRWGHAAGDELLRVVAGRLSQHVRVGDTVARIGGDEFAVLFEPLSAESSLRALGENLMKRVTLPMENTQRDYSPCISIGMASYPDHAATTDDLMKAADAAMYRAKASGDCELAVPA